MSKNPFGTAGGLNRRTKMEALQNEAGRAALDSAGLSSSPLYDFSSQSKQSVSEHSAEHCWAR